MRHETNTFSPIATPLQAFCRGTGNDGPAYGDEAVRAFEKTTGAAAAFIDLAREQGDEIVMSVAASAVPSGTVTREAFESIARTVVESVRAGCDAVLLDLHGAMVAQGCPRMPRVSFLRRIREAAPRGADSSRWTSTATSAGEDLVANADVIAGYCTYPHVDVYETGGARRTHADGHAAAEKPSPASLLAPTADADAHAAPDARRRVSR